MFFFILKGHFYYNNFWPSSMLFFGSSVYFLFFWVHWLFLWLHMAIVWYRVFSLLNFLVLFLWYQVGSIIWIHWHFLRLFYRSLLPKCLAGRFQCQFLPCNLNSHYNWYLERFWSFCFYPSDCLAMMWVILSTRWFLYLYYLFLTWELDWFFFQLQF